MAWLATARSVWVEKCFDAYGREIHRDARDGSPHCWDADHYPIPKSQGGPDAPWNLRALSSRVNRSLGAQLGNGGGLFGLGAFAAPTYAGGESLLSAFTSTKKSF